MSLSGKTSGMAGKTTHLLRTDLQSVTLASPLIAAAGTAGYVDELSDIVPLDSFGAITTKSITVEPRQGNLPTRILTVPGGMMNAIGLANVGLERFLNEIVPRIRQSDVLVIGSIAGGQLAEYQQVAEAMDKTGCIPAIELNVSCPNTKDGRQFSDSPELLSELIFAVREKINSSVLFVKLPPISGDPLPLARAAIESGAQGLTISNTFPGLAIDVETGKPLISRGTAGVSGPAIHALVVRMVHEIHTGVAKDASVPIIGVGGVSNWQHAAELILAGASAVGLGTVLFFDPRAPGKINRGLQRWLIRQKVSALSEMIGKVHI